MTTRNVEYETDSTTICDFVGNTLKIIFTITKKTTWTKSTKDGDYTTVNEHVVHTHEWSPAEIVDTDDAPPDGIADPTAVTGWAPGHSPRSVYGNDH